ncbi:MAG: ImmA/IrrE family metallo-endopeptidase [Bacteroidota bacterium]|nr:ImmA/IrrE family metallo-endopeptidase [Bacteroidota bacterium]
MPVDFSKISIAFLSVEEIRRRADEFREHYWGTKLPIDVELIAERNLKLFIIPVPDLRYQAQTEVFLSGDLKEIVYDPGRSDVRIRFSIAHEIGHFILHKDIVSTLRPSSYEDWKEIQQTIPDGFWGRAEYQAREFAGRLLVPRTLLIDELKALRPLIERAKDAVPDLELPVIKEFVSPKLAKRFFVSDEVIVRRIEAENISPIQ